VGPDTVPVKVPSVLGKRSGRTSGPCSTLYITNVPSRWTEADATRIFGSHPGFRKVLVQVKPLGTVCFVDYEDEKYATTVMGGLQGAVMSDGDGRGLRIEYARSQMSPNPKIAKITEMGGGRSSSNIPQILPGQRELPMISIGLNQPYDRTPQVGTPFQTFFPTQPPTFGQSSTTPVGFQGSYWPNPYSNQYGSAQGNPMMMKSSPSPSPHSFHEY